MYHSPSWSVRWKGCLCSQRLCLYNSQPNWYFSSREVHLRADFRYGPDDPSLWLQPWIIQYPHLGAIPRKPDDPLDPLSIIWWDPTSDDFESFGATILDGFCELSIT